MKKRLSKKGTNVLTENIIFIVLNLLFLSILILFLVSKMNDASVLEEKYAKQIALIIDSSKSGSIITLNIEDAIKKAGLNEKIVSIDRNFVNVKIKNGKGYSYSFFNDVGVNYYLNREKGEVVLAISEK